VPESATWSCAGVELAPLTVRVPEKPVADVGRNRTATLTEAAGGIDGAICDSRLNPDPLIEIAALSVAAPVLVMVTLMSLDWPTVTVPKFSDDGETERPAAGAGAGKFAGLA